MQEVPRTLINASVTRPQVYAVARSGDLAANGALLGGDGNSVISGNQVNITTTGDITNSSATIQGRELVSLNATNVRNLAGRIEGKAVALNATQDIENIGGAVIAQQSLNATAGRDILVQTTTLESRSAAPAQASAPAPTPGSLLGTVAGGASAGTSGNLQTRSTDISRVAGLYVTGDAGTLIASAGRDVELMGALVQSAGSTSVTAARNLGLSTVTTSASMDATRDSDNYNRTSRSAEVGSKLQSAGSTSLTAGQNITARAADVQAQTSLNVAAGSNVTIEAGVATSSIASASKTSNSGFMSSSSRTERSSKSSTETIASNFGGNTVTVTSGQDIGVKASNVVADKDVKLAAAGNVRIEAGTNTQSQSSYSAMSESGLMSSGGLDVSIGSRDQSTNQKNTRTTAAASTVGSTGGNVSITAGKTYIQTGSDVVVPAGDVTITAQKVDITSAAQNSLSQTDTEFKQSGLTLSISNPVLSAVQTINSMGKAIEKAKDGRMQALALASAGAAGYNAADAVQKGQGSTVDGKANQLPVLDDKGQVTGYRDATTADKMGGISINLSLGASSSSSHSTSQATTQRGSSVAAGGDVTTKAEGVPIFSDPVRYIRNVDSVRVSDLWRLSKPKHESGANSHRRQQLKN
ncbi:hemagglutinin repeat-containing protein [Rhodoferax sp.]|uniref:hemagglutinin repeat-containing protein n=1 Tax=Rhodoferax sp. TaxID=50421 RepID=UPI0025F09809|nr:hemagglutinin repeat-containing protein [Rhodoferax sp.]